MDQANSHLILNAGEWTKTCWQDKLDEMKVVERGDNIVTMTPSPLNSTSHKHTFIHKVLFKDI
jgi:hypothetical protein